MYGGTIISQFLRSNVGWVKVKLYNFHMKTKLSFEYLREYEKLRLCQSHNVSFGVVPTIKIFNVSDSVPPKRNLSFCCGIYTKIGHGIF